MKKKGQRTKLPLLAFEADSWTVDINYRKPASQARRADKSPRTGAPRSLRAGARPLDARKQQAHTGGLTSLESYGPRFSIPPGGEPVMSVRSSGRGDGTPGHVMPRPSEQKSTISPRDEVMRRCS